MFGVFATEDCGGNVCVDIVKKNDIYSVVNIKNISKGKLICLVRVQNDIEIFKLDAAKKNLP